jgi:molecular chaperone GrpE (heat shock protein)
MNHRNIPKTSQLEQLEKIRITDLTIEWKDQKKQILIKFTVGKPEYIQKFFWEPWVQDKDGKKISDGHPPNIQCLYEKNSLTVTAPQSSNSVALQFFYFYSTNNIKKRKNLFDEPLIFPVEFFQRSCQEQIRNRADITEGECYSTLETLQPDDGKSAEYPIGHLIKQLTTLEQKISQVEKKIKGVPDSIKQQIIESLQPDLNEFKEKSVKDITKLYQEIDRITAQLQNHATSLNDIGEAASEIALENSFALIIAKQKTEWLKECVRRDLEQLSCNRELTQEIILREKQRFYDLEGLIKKLAPMNYGEDEKKILLVKCDKIQKDCLSLLSRLEPPSFNSIKEKIFLRPNLPSFSPTEFINENSIPFDDKSLWAPIDPWTAYQRKIDEWLSRSRFAYIEERKKIQANLAATEEEWHEGMAQFIIETILPFIENKIPEIIDWHKGLPKEINLGEDQISNIEKEILDLFDVNKIEPELQDSFDPDLHVKGIEESNSEEPRGIILKVEQPGFRLRKSGKIIRRARVTINNY